MTIEPIIKTPISDLIVSENAANTILNLLDNFDDPSTTGEVVIFELYDTSIAGGIINVLLFDQQEIGAPLTVDNFLNYVNDGDYSNTIIHRSVPNFIIQGGGFTVNDLSLGVVPSDPAVQNEFSADRSNLRGTIAMAKLGNDPNSATNQWFFNLADNSENLDNQNGGFTVFGQVLSEDDLAVIDGIANITTYPATNIHPAFTDLPLSIDPNNLVIDSDDDFVRFQSITVSSLNELTFSVVSNSDPDLVNASINNNQLILDYFDNTIGTADITIRGTSLLGETVEDTFTISVESSNQSPTNLSLSNSSINENQPIATVIGDLSTTDTDIGNTFTYSLVTGTGSTDNNLFTISNNQLKTNEVFDFETNDSYSIRVRTTDQGGLFYEKELIINVTDVNDNVIPNITLALAQTTVTEDDTNNLIYTFTRGGNLTNALTVNYTISGTATNGTDYTNIGTSVDFAANSA
ncbi:peptidylprolyl isomerase, partial [Crocosphaera sp. XPORK-15E]|uniref:peptidylprolyl isomerase n=1 Tax=Crocosphaera sp. XPORK-15E TaxID=3110247 RepID=UPI002B213E4F